MARRARKLWLGDWQDAGEPTGADTFLVTPEDGGEPPAPDDGRLNPRRIAAAAAVIVALFAIGFALSSGGSDKPVVSSTPQLQQPQFPQAPVPQAPQGQGFGAPDLSGAAAAKAAAAALRKFPGNIERVTAGPGGGYVVHVFQDGYEVHVLVGPDFHVQGSDAGAAGGGGTPG